MARARYMPQEVFDAGALTLAMAKALGQDSEGLGEQLAASYRTTYGDGQLVELWNEASDQVLVVVPKLFATPMTNERLAQACLTLSRAITQFHSDGRRRKKRLLGGTFFNYEKTELPDKVSKCLENVAVYHVLLVMGGIDIHKLK